MLASLELLQPALTHSQTESFAPGPYLGTAGSSDVPPIHAQERGYRTQGSAHNWKLL